jgi:5-methylcytosine-specific restriction enzyme A
MATGWVGSNRRATLPLNWPEITLRILRRDHHRCQWVRYDTDRRCLRHANDVDHIIPYSQGGSDDDQNLQTLCPYHHGKKSGREGGLASGIARRARADAARPLHPGLSSTPQPEDPAPF